MKTKIILFVALLTLTSIIAAVIPDSSSDSYKSINKSGITPLEEQNLIYMIEEEKLAHDFYTLMLQKYDQRVFKNISRAETMHIGFVKELIVKYSVADPTIGKKEGEFTNSDLASLYISLSDKGNISLIDALRCGAEIEELDISDLNSRTDENTSEDIKETFIFLKEGSQRHLQAFVRNLKAAGESYTPIHLSQQQFDDIINNSDIRSNKFGNCFCPGKGNKGNRNNHKQFNGNCWRK